jgi:type II secretory pathway pseudopilin PulG
MRPHSQRRAGRRPPAARAESGFTILETVIAMFVALVVGFGAIGLFLFSASFNAGASDRARALAIAQETMEGLRAESYADLAAGTTTETVEDGEEAHSDIRKFTVVTEIENDGTTAPANRQKQITVTVTPEAAGGRFSPGGVTMSMLRASDEIGDN